ncbi:hypothetical protein D3C71_1502210 [compost metagenome]
MLSGGLTSSACSAPASPVRCGWPARRVLTSRHASRSGRQSSPSASNARTAAARCSSPSRHWPRYPSESSTSSCACRSNGASWSHLSRQAKLSWDPAGRPATRYSSTAAWQALRRRRCAVSQLLKNGLRPISSPSRKSPTNSADSAPNRSRSALSMPCCIARPISMTSTWQSPRSSLTMSCAVSILRRSGSSSRALALLRHQRSSPRGSFGMSHSSSQRCARMTACGASAR